MNYINTFGCWHGLKYFVVLYYFIKFIVKDYYYWTAFMALLKSL